MSLRVWLPLNGDLKNFGCSSTIITNTNATINNAGKIGKCYNFAKNAYLDINKEIMTSFSDAVSVCFWVKINSWNTNWDTIFQAGTGSTPWTAYKIGILRNSANYLCFTLGNASSSSQASYRTGNLTLNQWTHVTCVYSTGKCQTYLNGVLSNSYSTTYVPDFSGITSIKIGGLPSNYRCDCDLNDFRIYDHALSAAEVTEIARGLVVHYKLDNFTRPNLLTGNINNSNAWTADGVTITNEDGGLKVVDNGTSYRRIYNSVSNVWTTNGETFTVSFDARANIDGQIIRCSRSVADYAPNITINTSWKHYSAQIINTTSVTGGTLSIQSATANGIFWIKNIKLEKSSIESRFLFPGESDNIIQDSSGYGHNGSITGTLTASSDTPRYNTSTYFDGSSYVSTAAGTMSWYQMDQGTFACWMKPTADMSGWRGSWGICQDGTSGQKGWAITDYANTFRVTYTNGSTYITVSSGKALPQNEWHHCAATLDGTTLKMYFDGELVKTETINWGTATMPTATRMELGVDFPGTDEKFTGNYSDARFYVTPLLDNDIKMLYNVSMKVDNLGGIHTTEFKESSSRELIQGINITNYYGTHSNTSSPFTNYNSNGELYFNTNGSSAGSDYIPISPDGKTYYYDIDISINTGNQFYIGFERYDANKTSRSNNACTYVISTKPTEDFIHKRYRGTVNLSTDTVNPCAFVALRILNGWSGTTSGVTGIATIHSLSLREVTILQKPKLYKSGTLLTDEFNEDQKSSLYKNGFVEATEFIEL